MSPLAAPVWRPFSSSTSECAASRSRSAAGIRISTTMSCVRGRCKILDPAFAALIKELKARNLFDSTVVLWMGEFGRTPKINAPGGRDHWPHGFTAALAGGGIAGGRVIGETSPEANDKAADKTKLVKDPHPVDDLHATVLHALGNRFHARDSNPHWPADGTQSGEGHQTITCVAAA